MDVKFGHIPGTRVGQIFKDRHALKDAGIHANIQKGFGVQELVPSSTKTIQNSVIVSIKYSCVNRKANLCEQQG